MSFTHIFHVEDPNLKHSLIEDAVKSNLTTGQHQHNSHGILVSGLQKDIDDFVDKYKDKCTILLDNDHPNQVKGKFKSHMKRNSKEVIKEHLQSQGSNGGTAVWFSQYYNFPKQNGKAPVIAIISLGGSFQQSDLTFYWKNVCGLTTIPTVLTYTMGQSLPAFGSDSGADGENTLDLEICGAVCPGATLIFISAPNTNNGFYNAFSSCVDGITINGKTYNPSIVSCSWGSSESNFGADEIKIFNSIFQKGISKNVNFTAASGDDAASDGNSDNIAHVDFPAGSPYVVACGGTSVNPTTGIETLWSYRTSSKSGAGSGVSAFSKMPAWQQDVAVFPSDVTDPALKSLSGNRVVPDISLNADPYTGYTIYESGHLQKNSLGGTSCAAPLMAGLLGLMNLNYPVCTAASLYSLYKTSNSDICFNDITLGTNDNITDSNTWKCDSGFDYASGLGSVNGVNLFTGLKQLLYPPQPTPVPTPQPTQPVSTPTPQPTQPVSTPRPVTPKPTSLPTKIYYPTQFFWWPIQYPYYPIYYYPTFYYYPFNSSRNVDNSSLTRYVSSRDDK